ncbi:MAG: cytochrome P450 [Pseudomonadales bacterium]
MSIIDRIKVWGANNTPTVFAILRNIKPILIIEEFAIITRFNDVQEALSRPDALAVTYAERMGVITQGGNFFLGMNNTPTYTRDVSNMRIAVRRSDVDEIVAPLVEKLSNNIVAESNGKMDIVAELTSVVPAQFSAQYLGVPGPSHQELFEWTSNMFQYLFFPDNPKEVDQAAVINGAKACDYLDQLVAERKQKYQQGDKKDDIIGRCLELQSAGTPGMNDIDIRNNLIGIIIGLVPTTSKSAVLFLDYLLDHPELLAGAQKAALADDDEVLRKYMLESLRFNSFGAGVFRVAAEDYVVASGAFRSKKIRKGTKILVATQSAMLDGRELKKPKQFRLDRPDYHYMHFGYGMHTCFGKYINRVQIPLIVKSLLRCKNLRRAPGAAGKVEYKQPFPIHFNVEFDVQETAISGLKNFDKKVQAKVV